MDVLKEKSMDFAVRIVNLYKYLNEKKIYSVSDQILRAGTAVGVLYREAEHAESKTDFIHKLAIAQKECNEILFWLELMNKTSYISELEYNSMKVDAESLMKLLTSSIKTAKKHINH